MLQHSAMTHDGDPSPTSDVGPPEVTSAIDWTGSILTPRFLAALARAQAKLDTIGKTAWQSDQQYAYATADSIVGDVRRALSSQGISLVTSFRHWRPDGGKPVPIPDSSMRIDWHVRVEWALLFGAEERQPVFAPPDTAHDKGPRQQVYPAEPGEIAFLRGWCETVAIGGKGRPPDKSLYAARTSLAGYVALGVSAADRAIPPKSETIEERDDDGPSVTVKELRAQIARDLTVVREARRAAGLPDLHGNALADHLLGEPFKAGREGWTGLARALELYIEDLEQRVEAEVQAASDRQAEEGGA